MSSKFMIVVLFVAFAGSCLYFLNEYKAGVSMLVGAPVEMKEPGVDMVLKEIRVVEKKGDMLVVDLFSSKAIINYKKNMIALDKVKAELYDSERKPINVSADNGDIDKLTNDMKLKGNVTVDSKDGIKLTTDSLNWHASEKVFRTKDFVFIKGNAFELTGYGMESSIEPENIELYEKVEAVFY